MIEHIIIHYISLIIITALSLSLIEEKRQKKRWERLYHILDDAKYMERHS